MSIGDAGLIDRIIENDGFFPELTPHEIVFVGGLQFQDTATPKVVGSASIDMSKFPATLPNSKALTVKLVTVLDVNPGSLTANLVLNNLTDGETVTLSAPLTKTAVGPEKKEATVTRGNGVGEMKLSEKLYEVTLNISVGASNPATDRAFCLSAKLVLTYG